MRAINKGAINELSAAKKNKENRPVFSWGEKEREEKDQSFLEAKKKEGKRPAFSWGEKDQSFPEASKERGKKTSLFLRRKRKREKDQAFLEAKLVSYVSFAT